MFLSTLFQKINSIFVLLLILACVAQTKGGEENYNISTNHLYKSFKVFEKECAQESQELVMVFGGGRTCGEYPDNFYLVGTDTRHEPHLLMDASTNDLLHDYIGKLDVVIFEGFTIENDNDRARAYSNAYKLLKNNGVFLVCSDQNQKEALVSSQFIGSTDDLNNYQAPLDYCRSYVYGYVSSNLGLNDFFKFIKQI